MTSFTMGFLDELIGGGTSS